LAYIGSGSITQAIASGLLTTGHLHAPIEEAYFNLVQASDEYLQSADRVEGFGNSFYKDSIDPAFQPLFDVIAQNHPELVKRVFHIQKVAQIEHLFPNAAIITAMCLVICGLPPEYGMALFIKYRVSAWADLCLEA
jgi:citrate synthase